MVEILHMIAFLFFTANLPVVAPVPNDALPLDEPGRYRSVKTFDDTIKFYTRIFKQTGGVRWKNIINVPGLKVKHVASRYKTTLWEGINIYEKGGECRIFIVPRKENH